MVKQIHIGHLGMVKSKNRAKGVMFWPGMNNQIEDIVSSIIPPARNIRVPVAHGKMWQLICLNLTMSIAYL